MSIHDLHRNLTSDYELEPSKFLRIDTSIMELHAAKARQQTLHENPVLAIKPVLEEQIRSFEASLEQMDDPTLYVGAWLASFGQQRLIVVNQIQLEEPCLIIFHGKDEDGLPLSLIQHVSQLNFLLQACKLVTDEPRRPIGFTYHDNA